MRFEAENLLEIMSVQLRIVHHDLLKKPVLSLVLSKTITAHSKIFFCLIFFFFETQTLTIKLIHFE